MKVKFLDWKHSGCWINEDSSKKKRIPHKYGEYIHIVSIKMLLDGDEVEFQFSISYDDFEEGKVEILKLGKVKGKHKEYWKNLYDWYNDEEELISKQRGRDLLYNEVEWEECDERITIPFLFELREECNRISEEKGGGMSYRMDFFTQNHNTDYLKRRVFNIGESNKIVSDKDMGVMKVKFTDWKYVDSDGFFNDDDELYEISVNEGDWYFEVDGKDYCWSVRREEYLEEDGGGKGDGFWVRDLNDNDKVLVDRRWVGWGLDDCEFRSIDEKFNDEMSVMDFINNMWEYLFDNVEMNEYEMMDLFRVNELDDGGKDKLIGLEFEI